MLLAGPRAIAVQLACALTRLGITDEDVPACLEQIRAILVLPTPFKE